MSKFRGGGSLKAYLRLENSSYGPRRNTIACNHRGRGKIGQTANKMPEKSTIPEARCIAECNEALINYVDRKREIKHTTENAATLPKLENANCYHRGIRVA